MLHHLQWMIGLRTAGAPSGMAAWLFRMSNVLRVSPWTFQTTMWAQKSQKPWVEDSECPMAKSQTAIDSVGCLQSDDFRMFGFTGCWAHLRVGYQISRWVLPCSWAKGLISIGSSRPFMPVFISSCVNLGLGPETGTSDYQSLFRWIDPRCWSSL